MRLRQSQVHRLRGAVVVLVTTVIFSMPAMAGRLLDNADRRAEQDRPLLFRPAVPFDANLAADSVSPGGGRVRGLLYHQLNPQCRRTRGLLAIRKNADAGIKVSLFPATPYLVSYVGLLEEHLYNSNRGPVKPKKLIYDPRMLEYGLSSQTDAYGRFEFNGLRPGRYWVNADVSMRCFFNENVKTGSSEVWDGVSTAQVDHYTTEERYQDHPLNYRAFIEIQADGSLVELESELVPVRLMQGVDLQAEAP